MHGSHSRIGCRDLLARPAEYDCPFCRVVRGEGSRRNRPDHVIHRDALTTALVAPTWWRVAPGHILVVPNEHVENLYDLSDELGGAVLTTARAMALTLKQLDGCEGTSIRQHNEPGGNQDVWHLHVHVFPRTRGDQLYERHAEVWWPDAGIVSSARPVSDERWPRSVRGSPTRRRRCGARPRGRELRRD